MHQTTPLTLLTPSVSRQTKHFAHLPILLDPVYELATSSCNLIVSNGHDFRIGGARLHLPKFLFLGETGGAAPIELAIFAGLDDSNAITASIAAAHLLIHLDWQPDIATNYVLFSYPVVNPRRHASLPPVPIDRLFWQRSAEPEIRYLEKEFRQHSFKGVLTLRVDPESEGFYATTPNRLLGNEVVWPAVKDANREIPLDANPVRILRTSRTGRIDGQPKGRLSPAPDTSPAPFEVALYAPARAPHAAQIGGLIAGAKGVLRHYREFVSYAQNL